MAGICCLFGRSDDATTGCLHVLRRHHMIFLAERSHLAAEPAASTRQVAPPNAGGGSQNRKAAASPLRPFVELVSRKERERLTRGEMRKNRHRASGFCLRIIFSKNPFRALRSRGLRVRIMLQACPSVDAGEPSVEDEGVAQLTSGVGAGAGASAGAAGFGAAAFLGALFLGAAFFAAFLAAFNGSTVWLPANPRRSRGGFLARLMVT